MLLDDIGTYLQANGVGTLAVDLFKGYLPDIPDRCMALVEVTGKGTEYTMGDSLTNRAWEMPHLQVLSRGGAFDYATARQKSTDAFKLLDGLINTILSGTRYISIFALQSPFALTRDENDRPILIFNLEIMKDV